MILDNSDGKEKKVYQWLEDYTEEGVLDIVTGYFTIGALVHISEKLNDRVSQFRMILGSITNVDHKEIRTIDLLNEDINVDSAFKLVSQSKKAVDFLRQDKVIAKTLEPNFCHAKCYLFSPELGEIKDYYFISGSSNLTEAGIGLKHTNNVELNIAKFGFDSEYENLKQWFNDLWKSEKAHFNKTIRVNGAETNVDFKEHLIQEIENIFEEYKPKDIYYKVLYELYGEELTNELSQELSQKVKRLENSVVYNSLFDFQKRGVISLIKIINKYNGAILADAVGLGKTWTALAVMKFFQFQGREVILICPKRIEYNWRQYIKGQESRFEKDEFDFFIRFHTDLNERRMNSKSYTDERKDTHFINDKPKLFVIDESHNLKNRNTNRYKFLVNSILQKNSDVKVLLLTATPINNSLNDLGNQFRLLVRGHSNGFESTMHIENLDSLFKLSESIFNEWRKKDNPKINDLRRDLDENFFKLTDNLIVARTRRMIENQEPSLKFPSKEKATNIYITPEKIGDFNSFNDLDEALPTVLAAYKLNHYVLADESKGIKNDRFRENYLVEMLKSLMVKRLESSWISFYHTIDRIRNTHQIALDELLKFLNGNQKTEYVSYDESVSRITMEDESEDQDVEHLVVQNKVKLKDIKDSGNLYRFKEDLQNDINSLNHILKNFHEFKMIIDNETNSPMNFCSVDKKLENLIRKIRDKQRSKANNRNRKVVIFTHYQDTALYLYDQFGLRGVEKVAVVTGREARVWNNNKNVKPSDVLERFAPFTKLYSEKEWDFKSENYEEWKKLVKSSGLKNTIKNLENPIDILIATDTLSEGQNLQDADMIINYDIHWNPVRIIQRIGRIDRLGSPNDKIFIINFWPSESINGYLKLEKRIEARMAAMRLADSDIDPQITEGLSVITSNDLSLQKQNEKMLRLIIDNNLEELDNLESFTINKLTSIESFKQDLTSKLYAERSDKYRLLPNGIYSGFNDNLAICKEKGLIALLGYRGKTYNIHKKLEYELVYLNSRGEIVLENRADILSILKSYEDAVRFVPEEIDKFDQIEINKLQSTLKLFLKKRIEKAEEERKEILYGDPNKCERLLDREVPKVMCDPNNVEMITWLIISK